MASNPDPNDDESAFGDVDADAAQSLSVASSSPSAMPRNSSQQAIGHLDEENSRRLGTRRSRGSDDRSPTPTASASLSSSPSPSPSGSASRVSSPRPTIAVSPTIHLLASNKRATSAALLEIPGSGGTPSTLLSVSVSGHVGTYSTNRWRPQKTYRLWENTGGSSSSSTSPGGSNASPASGGNATKAKCWVTDAAFMEKSKHLVFSTSDQRLIIYDASASTHLREYEIMGLPSLVTSLQAVSLLASNQSPTTRSDNYDVEPHTVGASQREANNSIMMDRSEFTYCSTIGAAAAAGSADDDSLEELLILGDYRGFVRILRFLQPKNVLIPKGETDAGQVQFVKWQDLSNHRDYVIVETMSTNHGGPVAKAKYLKEKGWLLSCSKDPHHPLILHHPLAMLPSHHFLGSSKGISACDYSASCGLIAGGSWDGTIYLWSPMTPQQPYSTLQIPSSRLQDLAFIHSTLFSLSRDARLSVWDINTERLLCNSHLDFPAKKVLGKHLEYPAEALIPWHGCTMGGIGCNGASNAAGGLPQTILVGCCDYVAWLGLDWILADGSGSAPSTPLPGSGIDSFEWDKLPAGDEDDEGGLCRRASVRSNQSQDDYQIHLEVDNSMDARRASSSSMGGDQHQSKQSQGRSERARMLSVPTAANLYNERILVQVNRAMNFVQGVLVDPHSYVKEEKLISRSASDRRRSRNNSGKGSKWNLPKIQSLRLATPSRASVHLAMCRQELSKNKMLLNVDMGLPYCALNMPTLSPPGARRFGHSDDLQEEGNQNEDENQVMQLPITRSVSSQF